MITRSNQAREWCGQLSAIASNAPHIQTENDLAEVQRQALRTTGEMVTSYCLPLRMRIIANECHRLLQDAEGLQIRATLNTAGPEGEGRRVASRLELPELGRFVRGMIGKFDSEQPDVE